MKRFIKDFSKKIIKMGAVCTTFALMLTACGASKSNEEKFIESCFEAVQNQKGSVSNVSYVGDAEETLSFDGVVTSSVNDDEGSIIKVEGAFAIGDTIELEEQMPLFEVIVKDSDTVYLNTGMLFDALSTVDSSFSIVEAYLGFDEDYLLVSMDDLLEYCEDAGIDVSDIDTTGVSGKMLMAQRVKLMENAKDVIADFLEEFKVEASESMYSCDGTTLTFNLNSDNFASFIDVLDTIDLESYADRVVEVLEKAKTGDDANDEDLQELINSINEKKTTLNSSIDEYKAGLADGTKENIDYSVDVCLKVSDGIISLNYEKEAADGNGKLLISETGSKTSVIEFEEPERYVSLSEVLYNLGALSELAGE